MRRISTLIGLTSLAILLCAASAGYNAVETARFQPIQNNGRIKAFDGFARSTLKLLAGRDSWNKKDASSLFYEAAQNHAAVSGWTWIRVDYIELKKNLGLDSSRNFFSYNDLVPAAPKILSLVKSSQAKRQADTRPTKLEQKAELLQTQILTVEAILSGEIFRVVPPAAGHEEWQPGGDPKDWPKKIYNDRSWPAQKLRMEVLYFKTMPFEWAAALYFIAFFLLAFLKGWDTPRPMGIVLMGMAVMFHTSGLVARCLILGRPPVSNMFESMIFMNWALVVYAMIFAMIYRNVPALAMGSLISGFIMLYAHLLPIDSGLEVLVPVLRSNYWLTIHVMTIVSSYGAFGLAMGLGHLYLIRRDASLAPVINRVIQLGTVLIGTGTVLGGVWANESWGRFWGWDPKETWALITFLGYLIVVHLRFLNRLSDYALGLCSVLGFGLVLMTWYGVNFVLGRGLHSYGQGSGGMQWVIYFLVFEAIFLAYVLLIKPKKS
jgi:ABC-type transport system involved in cytochrome c biogenesis permease subunit